MAAAPARAGPLALAMLAAQAVAAGAGAAGTLLLAAVLPAEAFGRGMLLISVATLVSMAASGNLEALALRALHRGPPGRRAAFVRFSRRVVLCGGAVGGLGCILLAPGRGALEAGLVAALVPALAFVRVTARQGVALGGVLAGVMPRLLARPLVFLGAGGALVLPDLDPGAWLPPALLLAAMAGAAAVQLRGLQARVRRLGPAVPVSRARRVRWLAAGAAMMPGLLFLEFHRDLAVAAAGLALSPEATGRVALALTLVALPGMACVAAEVACGARIAGTSGAARQAALRYAALLRCAPGAPALVALALAAGPVGAVAGVELGALVWWLSAVPLARMLGGNPVQLLMLAGRPATVAAVCLPGAAIEGALIWIGATGWGPAGAAAGAAAGYCAAWLILCLRARRLSGADPTVLALLTPARSGGGLRRRARGRGRRAPRAGASARG